jgi:pfkB family carbohydrate kinase
VPKIGILGSLVWDVIHGRDSGAPPVEEWGGIAYSLAGLDAALAPGWDMVPLIKVGQDLRDEAAAFFRTLTRLAPRARCVEVPSLNNRVVLHYETAGRRCERMSGGVPGWTWTELGPMVRDLDAIYVNFISGFELSLGATQALRRGFGGPIYADLHSLFLGMRHDGIRVLRPLAEAADWFASFDVVQMNEDEMHQLGAEPLEAAAEALQAGVRLLLVTAGPRGSIYVAAAGWDGWTDGQTDGLAEGQTVRTALVAAPTVEVLDPTGCGDVFGATCCARLLAGDGVEASVREGNRLAARNAAFRGASGLAAFLRGELVSA